MSNYVWNKVVCSGQTLEKYFLDSDPFGDGKKIEHPYITFNKLFDVKSLDEYEKNIGRTISYSWGTSYKKTENGNYEIKFAIRWDYPIKAIVRAIELDNKLAWYSVEENHLYVSKFYWSDEKIKEDVLYIEDEYHEWSMNNNEFEDMILERDDGDDGVWYFLPNAVGQWRTWESIDGFKRYYDIAANNVKYIFEEKNKLAYL